ncbi:zf-4CXXC_R1 domain-containing protein, partial [Cephalotus follicularis]
NNNENNNDDDNINNKRKGSEGEYDKLREKRIKENMEKMQKLGILGLSLKLKTSNTTPPRRNVSSFHKQKIPQRPFSAPEPSRRSSRLQTLAPVSYSEFCKKKKGRSSKNREIRSQESSQPEIYTEEHCKLLGDCKTTWTLCVDGYGKDHKRIYDPVKGETCHQCRQKTLGYHTHCYKCDMVQGQFCGDCLYMRYGENVIEANQNPNWICPVCRGICNCSLCRQAKGWAPTGLLYRKAIALGFKSVAHFLIQTRRSQPKSEDSGAETVVSTQTLLPSCNESVDANDVSDGFRPEDHEDDIEEEKMKCNIADSKYADSDGGCKRK